MSSKISTPAPQANSSNSSFIDVIQPFIIGGSSGMLATCVIQPIDMIKGSISPISVAKEIAEAEGIKGFYRGIDSALARQIFYTTTRLGIYKTLTEKIKDDNMKVGQKNLSFFQKAYTSMFAGFIGSLVGNPADLALVRMQADARLPAAERRNYTNVVDAFKKIVQEEGFLSLWRGATPTVIRAIVLNLAMLSSYDEVKEQFMHRMNSPETLSIRVYASMVSGFLSSFCSLPFDNAKTKIQKMKALPDGTFPYKNIFDAMQKTVTKEGFSHLWVGFPTFYFRIAPHVCITLVLQDFLTDTVKKLRGKKQH